MLGRVLNVGDSAFREIFGLTFSTGDSPEFGSRSNAISQRRDDRFGPLCDVVGGIVILPAFLGELVQALGDKSRLVRFVKHFPGGQVSNGVFIRSTLIVHLDDPDDFPAKVRFANGHTLDDVADGGTNNGVGFLPGHDGNFQEHGRQAARWRDWKEL